MEPELVIEARLREMGGFSVRRVLPATQRKLVGPFIFYDHLTRTVFEPGQGLDVRPHPHISLATVTYLFEGAFMHKDSLGYAQLIEPGAVNWMIAGRGIAHSERTPPELRQSGGPLHGIQCWVALPREHEEIEPSFAHHPRSSIPRLSLPGVELSVIAGNSYGLTSPVRVLSPTLYAHARLSPDSSLAVDEGHAERAVYVASGSVSLVGASREYGEGTLLILPTGAQVSLHSREGADAMLLGGAPLDGDRHIYWNFVSSSLERLERAKLDWRERRFATVVGDEAEFIPLPDELGTPR
ncbi:MAG TPA: pirin family protein [Polyangiaceae bacterium]|nr:pirin family protein [Polyangiaceae bacterium]